MSQKVTGKVFDFQLFKRLLNYIRFYRLNFVIALVSVLIGSLLSIVNPRLLIDIVDNYIPNKNSTALLSTIAIMLGVLLLKVIFQFLFIYFANWLGQHIIKDIRSQLFKHMLRFKMQYFNNTPVGKLVTRSVSDIETIASIFGQGLFMIVSDLLTMLVVMLFMLYKNWQLAFIAFTVLPILIYATKIFQKAMKSAFNEVRNQVSDLNTFVQERLVGMKIVQLFTREKIEYDSFKIINDKHKKAWIKAIWYNSIFFPIAEIFPSIAIGFIVWYGGLSVIGGTFTTTGEIIAFIMLCQLLFRPLRQIADKFNTLQMGMVAADRVFNILDENEQEINEGTLAVDSMTGRIDFEKVNFSYVKDELVLRNVSFTVKPGETIAVVGATGAGKSTIINLLNRFYDINDGEILIDNISVNEYTLASLRNNIAVVLQDVFLFSDSIYNNITLNNTDITLEEVKEAAKVIGVHDFIMTLPNNYDYNVKERGVMLSAGQRQLISFLRAYVSDPAILILDEATSSIDSQSEILIQKATNKITKGRTSIVIAHRLATVKKADRIIVMEKGRIVEQGTHKELLRQKGYYSKLYEIQFATALAS